ncbi:MAG TPA: MFS transporter [Candidatus Obscuribacterales bacterium]
MPSRYHSIVMREHTSKTKLPGGVWVLGIASLLTDVSSEMIHAVLPLFLVSSLGASTVFVGLIEGTGEAVASCLKVVSGSVSDYFRHRKWLVVAGYGLSTCVKPLFAVAQNPFMVLIARSGDRVGKGIRSAPRDALIADLTAREMRGAAYGLRQSLDSVGAFLGPAGAIVILIFHPDNFRLVFWLALIPAVLTVILLAVAVREPAKSAAGDEQKADRKWVSPKELGRNFWVLFVVAVIFNLGNSSDAFIILKAKENGIENHLIPLILIVMNVAYSLCAYPAGVLSDRFSRRGLIVVSFCLYALVYIGLALITTPTMIWILMCFYGLYHGISQGVMLALISDHVAERMRGTAFGFYNLGVGISLLPASLLGGWLWKAYAPSATFYAGSAFALLALTVFLCAHQSISSPSQSGEN